MTTSSTVSKTLRLPSELDASLKETAAREGRSENAVIVLAVERYTSDRARRRDEAIARIITEDGPLLERLAQ